jgi:hypothetical protein
LSSERIRGLARPSGFVLIDPRAKITGCERRKRQQQIAEIALWIDRDDRNAIDCRLLNEGQAQPGLAASCHPRTHRVRHEIAGVIQHRRFEPLSSGDVVFATEIEESEFFEVLHRGMVMLNRGSRFGARGSRLAAGVIRGFNDSRIRDSKIRDSGSGISD